MGPRERALNICHRQRLCPGGWSNKIKPFSKSDGGKGRLKTQKVCKWQEEAHTWEGRITSENKRRGRKKTTDVVGKENAVEATRREGNHERGAEGGKWTMPRWI